MADYQAGSASVVIKPDLRRFERLLKDELKRIKADLGVDITPKMDEFRDSLRDELGKLSAKDRTVELEVDTSKVDKVRKDLAEPQKLKLDADTSKVDEKIEKTDEKLDDVADKKRTATIDTDVDGAGSEALLDALARNRRSTIRVNVDARQALAALAEVKLLSAGVGAGSMAVGTGSTIVGTLGTMISGLVAPTAAAATNMWSLVGALNVAPAALGAMGAGLTSVIVGFNGMGEALGAMGDPEKFAEALEDLTPSAREFATAVSGLKDEWKNVKESAQEALFDGLGPAITTLGERQLPTLAEGFRKINAEVSDGWRQSMEVFSTTSAVKDFEVFLGNTASMFTGLSGMMGNLSRAWIDLATVGSEYLPALGAQIDEITGRWAGNLFGARLTGELNESIDTALEGFRSVGEVVGDLGGILAGVWTAAADAGTPFLGFLAEAISGLDELANSAAGQAAMVDFFTDTANVLAALGDPAKALAQALAQDVLPAFEGLVTSAAPGLTEGITRIGDAFVTLAPGISSVGGAIGQFVESFGVMADFLSPLLNVVLELIGALGGLAPVLVPLGALVTTAKLLSGAMNLLEKDVQAISKSWSLFSGNIAATPSVVTKANGSLTVVGGSLRDVNSAYRDLAPQLAESNRLWAATPRLMSGVATAGEGVSRVWTGTMDRVTSAGRGFVDFMGGPWGVALAGGAALAGAAATGVRDLSTAQDEAAAAAALASEAQGAFFETIADGGDQVETAEQEIRKVKQSLDSLADNNKWSMALGGVTKAFGDLVTLDWGSMGDHIDDAISAGIDTDFARESIEALEEMGISAEEASLALTGSYQDWAAFEAKLRDGGAGQAAVDLGKLRDAFVDAKRLAEEVGPAGVQLGEALRDIAAGAGDAADNLNRYRLALAELRGLPISQAEATAQLHQELAKASGEMENFAGATLGAEGMIDLTTESGQALWEALGGIGSAVTTAIASGKDADEIWGSIGGTLEQMRVAAGIGAEEWAHLTETLMLTPEQIELLIDIDADPAIGAFEAVKAQMDELKAGEEIKVKVGTQVNADELDRMGFNVKEFDGENGYATLTLDSEEAEANLDRAIEGLRKYESTEPKTVLKADVASVEEAVDNAKNKAELLATGDYEVRLYADDEAGRIVEGVVRKGEELNGSEFVPRLGATAEEYYDVESGVRASGEALEGSLWTAEISAEQVGVEEALYNALASGESWSQQEFEAYLTASDLGVDGAVDEALFKGNSWAEEQFEAALSAEDYPLAAAIAQAVASGDTFAANSFISTLTGDPAPFHGELGAATASGRAFAGDNFVTGLDGDKGAFDVELGAANTSGRTFAGTTFAAKVSAKDEATSMMDGILASMAVKAAAGVFVKVRAALTGNATGGIAGLFTGGVVDQPVRLHALASGGRLPVTGPGTDTTDGILGVDGEGMPTARVDAGEWVINRNRSELWHDVLAAINFGSVGDIMSAFSAQMQKMRAGTVPTLASGGRTTATPSRSAYSGVDSLGTAGVTVGTTFAYVDDFRDASNKLSASAVLLSEAVKSGNEPLAREIVAQMSAEFMPVFDSIANPDSYTGISARALGGQAVDIADMLGMNTVSTVAGGLLGAERELVDARRAHTARINETTDAEKKLTEAREELHRLETESVEMSKSDSRKLADAERAAAEAGVAEVEGKTAEARAKSAERNAKKISDAEEKLARAREDVAGNQAKAEEKRREEIARQTEVVARAENELVEARIAQADALDMSLHSLVPQISQLAGEGAGLAAANGLGQVASALGAVASLAGPAGVSVGVAIEGVKQIIGIAQMLAGVIDDYFETAGRGDRGRWESAQQYAESMVKVNKLIVDQKFAVIDLADRWVDATRRMHQSILDVQRAQAGVPLAQLEGARQVDAIRRRLEEARRGSGGGGGYSGPIPGDMGLLYDSYSNQLTATPNIKQDKTDLGDVVDATNEIAALESELIAAQINTQILMHQASLELLNADHDQMLAQLEMNRLLQAMHLATERTALWAELNANISMDQYQAQLQQAASEALARQAEAQADLNNPLNQLGSLLDWNNDGKTLFINNEGSQNVIGARAQKESAQQQLDNIGIIADKYGVELNLGNIDKNLGVLTSMYESGNQGAIDQYMWGSELGAGTRALETADLLGKLADIQDREIELKQREEDIQIEWNHLLEKMPLEQTIADLENRKIYYEAQAEYLRDSSEELSSAAENVMKFSENMANMKPTEITVSIPSRGQMVDPDDIAAGFDMLGNQYRGLDFRVTRVEEAGRTRAGAVAASRG